MKISRITYFNIGNSSEEDKIFLMFLKQGLQFFMVTRNMP